MQNQSGCIFESNIEIFATLAAEDILAVKFFNHLDACESCKNWIQGNWTGQLPQWLRNIPEAPNTTSPPDAKSPSASGNGSVYRQILIETISRDIQSDLDFLPPSPLVHALGSLGGLELIGILGSGGMGIVFEALDLRTGEKFALKTLKMGVATQSSLKKKDFLEKPKL